MKLISTPRTELVRGLATEFLHNYGKGRTIVAVDGADASGREALADDLAAVFEEREHPVIRASLKYFRLPKADQGAFGPDTAERRYRHGYDYAALRRVLVEPFRLGAGAGFVTRHFDPDRDAWIEPDWLTAPKDATLIIDGEFINRPELRDLWYWSVLVDGVPEGTTADTEAELLYRREASPSERVAVVVDNTDPERPVRRFFDSC